MRVTECRNHPALPARGVARHRQPQDLTQEAAAHHGKSVEAPASKGRFGQHCRRRDFVAVIELQHVPRIEIGIDEPPPPAQEIELPERNPPTGETVRKLIDTLRGDPSLPMITAASPLGDQSTADNPNVVKVVVTSQGDALYFSRSRIPFARNPPALPCYRHLGIYGYSRQMLLAFVGWPPSPLEVTEGLEQLRALERGTRIRILLTDDDSPGVDTPEQAAEVEARMEGREIRDKR